MLKGLDHVAIVVSDTEEALRMYRDRLGFPVLFSEKVNNDNVLLTHLDMGNTQLQLVEPLVEAHPLQDFLCQHGPGLHHLCFAVEDVEAAMEQVSEKGLELAEDRPHQGTQGRRAVLLAKASTGGVQVELTGS